MKKQKREKQELKQLFQSIPGTWKRNNGRKSFQRIAIC